ncbi:hypothetical protein ABZ651_06875, partial [Streptomyces sp. NPDC007070]
MRLVVQTDKKTAYRRVDHRIGHQDGHRVGGRTGRWAGRWTGRWTGRRLATRAALAVLAVSALAAGCSRPDAPVPPAQGQQRLHNRAPATIFQEG